MGFRINAKKLLEKFRVIPLNSPEECRELAFKVKGDGGIEGEREEKEVRKGRIKAKLMSNETIAFNIALGRVVGTDLVRRVDSQHTCEVWLEMTPEEWGHVRFPLVAFWGEYDCDTVRDVADLFEQFNAQWSARDNKDIMGAHVNVNEDLRSAKVSVHIALPVAGGILWYRNRIGGQKLTRDFKYQIVHEEVGTHDFFIRCNSFLHPRKTKEMLSPSVIAALYCTATDDASWAFWRNVASGKSADLDSDSMEFKLDEFLDMCKDSKAEWPRTISKHFGKKPEPSDLDVFATCLQAFRAWKKGRKLADIFKPTKGRKPAEVVAEFADVIGHRGEEEAA